MRREPSLTFRGALEILGQHDRPAIEKLDVILGGVILASGVAAGVAAGGLALAPVGLWAAIWGWTEQKDAAMGLLRKALNSASRKLTETSGYERRQLIAAAHTTIVMAALFDALREEIGKHLYDELNISDRKVKFLAGEAPGGGNNLFALLYSAEVPAPSPAQGFEENVADIYSVLEHIGDRFQAFLHVPSSAIGSPDRWRNISARALERYRSYFLELAAKVPEFAIWAMLGEHSATRTLVRQQNGAVTAALDQQAAAMARVEALLALTTGAAGVVSDLRAMVDRANRRVLDQPIIPAEGGRHGPDITLPPVSLMYINPQFRVAEFDPAWGEARIADEHWWDNVPSRKEFDLLLAAYVATPNATRLPMLLLGDPGAGKSMLTRMLAARLGGAGYTVVYVPLRRVGATAPIGHQIQQALDEATTERVTWAGLSDQSVGTTRVVLLDGLDELLQASSSDRSGYLQEIADFQDAEAAQERPLVVIVTSRIVVADRVDIPHRTVVVKLDTFTDEDIADWLSRWRDGNSVVIKAGRVRALTLDSVLRQPELARQPLLLLMLAIYAADPALPSLDADISTADLYRSILEEFGRREARKALGDYAGGQELTDRVQDHLDRLAIAALAMFNRGRQDISEDELGADLKALAEHLMGRSRPDEAGQRVIGEFFFVHAPEARMTAHGGKSRRRYEFLHATFGEYLVASRVMAELCEVAARAFAGRRGPSAPEDDLLFALLSHQPLAARASTLTFAAQIADGLPSTERIRLPDTLEMLLEIYRDRHGSDLYANYRPTPSDTVRQLACYSANLVLLRVALEPGKAGIPLTTLLRVPEDDGLLQWRSLVMLWQSGLDASGMQAMLTALKFDASPPAVRATAPGDWLGEEVALAARLLGDRDSQWRIKYGTAIWDHKVQFFIGSSPEDWVHEISRMLIPLAVGEKLGATQWDGPPDRVNLHDSRWVAVLISNYLRASGGDLQLLNSLISILLKLPGKLDIDGYALARSVILQPGLLDRIPRLRNPNVYGSFYALIEAIGDEGLQKELRGRRPRRKFVAEEMRNLLGHIVRESGARPWTLERDDT